MIHSDYGTHLDNTEDGNGTNFVINAEFNVSGTHTIEVYGGDSLVEDHSSWTFSVNGGED
jgi:hypothetical protein